MANGSSRNVDESSCDAEQNLTLPISRDKCQIEKCPFWRPGPWSKVICEKYISLVIISCVCSFIVV